jgi:hypothetical protein
LHLKHSCIFFCCCCGLDASACGTTVDISNKASPTLLILYNVPQWEGGRMNI